jgi:hypothetical protein
MAHIPVKLRIIHAPQHCCSACAWNAREMKASDAVRKSSVFTRQLPIPLLPVFLG